MLSVYIMYLVMPPCRNVWLLQIPPAIEGWSFVQIGLCCLYTLERVCYVLSTCPPAGMFGCYRYPPLSRDGERAGLLDGVDREPDGRGNVRQPFHG